MNRAASLVAVTPPRHIGQIFFQRVAELGDRPFVRFRKGGAFESLAWSEFGAMTQALALGLRAQGLAAGDTVAIMGNNSVRWLSADLATLASGLANVIVSPLLSDTLLRKILDHAGCRAAFVEDESAVARLLRLHEQLPALEQIFVMSEDARGLSEAVPFYRLIELGGKQDQRGLEEILEGVHADDLATIMYTSGSTGEPKGVMRTQNNLLANITNGGEIVTSAPDELLVVVLSLNHLYGRFGFLKSAVIGRSIALVDATELDVDLEVLRELAGTAMALVPRVMERLWNEMLDRDDNRDAWNELEALDDRKQNVGLEPSDERRFQALRLRLTQSARRLLGGRMKYISYGGAAMPPRIMNFFHLTAIPLLGSYGSTECGGVTLSGIGERRPGNLGKPFANVELRIAADGEILVRGPTVTPGYFKDPQATATAFDKDGWFYTGDLGVLETDGTLKIVGRKKDVFYCTDGSNIYPGFIESRLESEPFIRQAILLGDHRPFVAALVVPDRERIASSASCESGSLSAAATSAALWTAIERVNLGLEACERIRQIAILDNDFPMAARTVNIFQKIKVDRSWVASHFEREIAAIYAAQGGRRPALNQVALITGGGGGIGGAVAQRMAGAGIAVVIADYDAAAAQTVKDEIAKAGGQAEAVALDVTAAREVKAVVADVEKRFGRIDILANIAGGSAYTKRIEELTWSEWKEVMDVNLKGTFLMCREVAPIMQRQKSGRIINTASNYGVTGSALRTPYAAAKAGIITFTKSLALELAPDSVLANTVAPGPTDTPRVMEKESGAARRQRWWPNIPLGRTAMPQDLAEMYYFLTTPESAAITGQTFHVNGGVVMP